MTYAHGLSRVFNVNVVRYIATQKHLLELFPRLMRDSTTSTSTSSDPSPLQKDTPYLLTCIDRYTRWPEAITLSDITADTVARNFITHWIARFGAPSTITTDRGRQFESHLFRALTDLLGTTRIRTTSYHPASNGLVERLHRQLKAAIKTRNNLRWTEVLPLVLLGIRTAIKADLGCSTAELVYGTGIYITCAICDTNQARNLHRSSQL